ncbi:T9SS type B sorting domain-containing protein [Mariniflexile ostreae]|uniref:T9SS type B sorting domain-containing protein n=1 Tax=Mariniflexile ostreae TaxID=1520892 RepID=A0ABV5FFB4_9FLAO
MKNTLILSFFLIFIMSALAQNEADYWYFGSNAGITFNLDGSSTTLTNGKLKTQEGCTTISDSNGELLFYTDGITIWNKNHDPMPNANAATGNGLYGDPSSTQSALVVPKPDSPNIFYVFTVDTTSSNLDSDEGFNYSVVDLNLNNGLGDVVLESKNINLLQDSSEKITAVSKDCVTKSIWVITFAPLGGTPGLLFDTFYAYEISSTGVNPNPITSSFNIKIDDPRGYLKFSPDGKKLACANSTSGLYLYDFDTATGKVSNQKAIQINVSPLNKPQSPYGIEFSQNSKLLYVSAYYEPTREEADLPTEHYGSLLQYDLTKTNISNTETVIDHRQMYRGALQLGPNGKIYRAMSKTYTLGASYLSTINNPNELGVGCAYSHNSVNLSPNLSTQGLPPFITSFFSEKIDIIGNASSSTTLDLCLGESYTLEGPELPGATYTWTHNGAPISHSRFDLKVNEAGLYRVVIDQNNGDCKLLEGEAYVSYNALPVAFDATLVQCDEDGVPGGVTRFNLNQAHNALTGGLSGLSTKFYSDNARLHEVNADTYLFDLNKPDPIYVEVINDKTNCFDTVILTLEVSTSPIDNFTFEVCDDVQSQNGLTDFNLDEITLNLQKSKFITLPITYYTSLENALLEKDALISSTFKNTLSYEHTIYARIENKNTCEGLIKVLLKVNKLPQIVPDETVFFCSNTPEKSITIEAGNLNNNIENYTYQWNTGDTTHSIQIDEINDYTVTITHKTTGCSIARTVHVEPSSIARNPSFEVTDASHHNSITILVFGEGHYEYAITHNTQNFSVAFQQSPVFENIPPGIYTARVKDIKNDCGTLSIAIPVIGFPKFFTPNNDGIHDTWQMYGTSDLFYPHSKISIYNRYGTLIKEIDPLGNGWDGRHNGTLLPTDDYWFSAILEDGRVFKNHFTLKH